MNRLRLELDRLYGWVPGATAAERWTFRDGVRAAMLEVTLPAPWESLAPAWRGVQADLDLPAPAIAVSGTDGFQLWFSFAPGTSTSERAGFLRGVRARYLADVPDGRVRETVDPEDFPTRPCMEVGPQRWSTFVTPDLASVFGDTPWIDLPPGDESQATILRSLATMPAAAARLASRPAEERGGAPAAEGPMGRAIAPGTGPAVEDPAIFLSRVMNDPAAPLALRVEAAGLLLAHGTPRPAVPRSA